MLGLLLGIPIFLVGWHAIQDRKIMLQRERVGKQGQKLPASYWEGRKAVLSGYLCLAIGGFFFLGGIANVLVFLFR